MLQNEIFKIKFNLYLTKIWLFLFIFILFQANCKNPIEESCDKSCLFIKNCALKIADPTIPVGDILKKAKIQCLGTCTMNYQSFNTCYVESKDNCNKFFECIISSGVVN